MIDASKLSIEAKRALKDFGEKARLYHRARKVCKFRYSELNIDAPPKIQHEYIDAKIRLRSFDELKPLMDQIDTGILLDKVEGQGAEAQAAAYAQMVAIEKSIPSK